jgi:hypothetical protein
MASSDSAKCERRISKGERRRAIKALQLHIWREWRQAFARRVGLSSGNRRVLGVAGAVDVDPI